MLLSLTNGTLRYFFKEYHLQNPPRSHGARGDVRAAALDVRDEPRHRAGCNRGRCQQAQRVGRLALTKVVRAVVVVPIVVYIGRK